MSQNVMRVLQYSRTISNLLPTGLLRIEQWRQGLNMAPLNIGEKSSKAAFATSAADCDVSVPFWASSSINTNGATASRFRVCSLAVFESASLTSYRFCNSYTMVAGIYRRKPPRTRGRSPRERAWFSNDKSLATMVYLLYILLHWSMRHTSSIDTAFNLATTYSNGLSLF